MITIKELADRLGVSKQAVYNRIMKDPLYSQLNDMEGAVNKSENGAIYLSDQGAALVQAAYESKYQHRLNNQEGAGFGRTSHVKKKQSDSEKLEAVYTIANDLKKAIAKFDAHVQEATALLQKKDKTIEDLQAILLTAHSKSGELAGQVASLSDTIAVKDQSLQGLTDKNIELSSVNKVLKAQLERLKSQVAAPAAPIAVPVAATTELVVPQPPTLHQVEDHRPVPIDTLEMLEENIAPLGSIDDDEEPIDMYAAFNSGSGHRAEILQEVYNAARG